MRNVRQRRLGILTSGPKHLRRRGSHFRHLDHFRKAVDEPAVNPSADGKSDRRIEIAQTDILPLQLASQERAAPGFYQWRHRIELQPLVVRRGNLLYRK